MLRQTDGRHKPDYIPRLPEHLTTADTAIESLTTYIGLLGRLHIRVFLKLSFPVDGI